MQGIKHLISCRCTLPQYKDAAIFHKFIVFSVVDDTDNVVPKMAQCNNCGVIHKVIDLCKSDILNGNESAVTLPSIDDIKICLPERLISILEKYNAIELATWEATKFIVDNQRWGDFIVLATEIIDGSKTIKILRILGNNLFNIESITHAGVVE
jgi:hypothetical protein